MLRLIEDGKPENCYKYKLFTREKQFLMAYTGTGRDVADPWYTGDFETTFQDLLEGCEGMVGIQ